MPRDVVLGEGYEGDVMVTPAHPGQHVGHYNVQDGSHSLLQRESGVGAPPHHHHHGGGGRGRGWGGGWGWGPGYVPYEPLYVESIILDRTKDDDDDNHRKPMLKGFSGLGAAEVSECVNRIINAAAVGARESIKGVESGVYNSLNDVCNHIRRRVCAEVQSHHSAYAKAVSEAVKSAFAEAKPHVEEMLAGRPKGVSDFDESEGLDGLGGTISSQADFNLLSKAQVRVNGIMAEISGIGKDEWDAIKNEEFESAQWSPADNYSYDNMMGFWLNNMKSLIHTAKHPVTVEQINEVNRLATGTEGLIALVKSHATPAAVAQGEADKASTVAALSKSGLVSPGSAGWDQFQKDVTDKAASLTSSGMGIATIAAIAFGLGTAIYLWSRS